MFKRFIQLVLSAVLGGAVFLFFHSLVEAGLLFASLFGLAAALGGFLLLSPKKIDPEFQRLAEIYGLTPDTVRKTIGKGETKVRALRREAEAIGDKKVREDVERISNLAEKIYVNFKTDPKDIKAARQFLNYYLDATIKIIRQYVRLADKGPAADPEMLRKAEDVLGTIENAFEKQLKRLYDDDYLDLDTEISTLKKTMKMDGMS